MKSVFFFIIMTERIYSLFLKLKKVSIDTREDVSGSIFFALSGENFDGNQFAQQALKKGAAYAIIDKQEIVNDNDERYILVKDVLKTLQNLAAFHRSKFHIPVIAITGTNGKTTTKELISAVLKKEKKIISTQGNLNNHIGVPLTVLKLTEQTEIAVIEMGANHPGEIKFLCNIAQPTHGIITNIGKAHLEGFGNLEGVINTKNELYDYLKNNHGTAFVNSDDRLLMALSAKIPRVTYGTKSLPDGKGEIMKTGPNVTINWKKGNKNIKIRSHLFGSYNFSNLMASIAVGIYFKISEKSIHEALEAYIPKNNRSQFIKTKHNTLILDAYNANPESMKLALTDFYNQYKNNTVIILGDMFELGKVSDKEHKKIIDLLEQLHFDNVFLTGKEFSKVNGNKHYITYRTTNEIINYIKKHPIKNKTILIKGSRGMKLEALTPFL